MPPSVRRWGRGGGSRWWGGLEEYRISVSLPGYSRLVPQRPLPRPLLLVSEFLSISVGGSRWGQSSPLSSRLAILSPSLHHDPPHCLLSIEVCPSLSIIPLNRANKDGRGRRTLVSKPFLAQAVPPTPSGLWPLPWASSHLLARSWMRAAGRSHTGRGPWGGRGRALRYRSLSLATDR